MLISPLCVYNLLKENSPVPYWIIVKNIATDFFSQKINNSNAKNRPSSTASEKYSLKGVIYTKFCREICPLND